MCQHLSCVEFQVDGISPVDPTGKAVFSMLLWEEAVIVSKCKGVMETTQGNRYEQNVYLVWLHARNDAKLGGCICWNQPSGQCCAVVFFL